MKVYKISQWDEGGDLILDNLRDLPDLMGGIEDENVGTKYIIEVTEMDESVYENLPEWGGF